jgi:signal transduction histidine kinase
LLIAAIADAIGTRTAVTLFSPTVHMRSFVQMVVFYFDFDVGAYLVVVAGTEVFIAYRALIARQRVAEQLGALLSRARLDYLEAQLQPHFLFNSLGAVSELAYDAPATATRVLRQLAAIFRTALARKTDEITLGDEIVGIEPYLDIQRIRFADWLTIDYRIDDAAVDCLVPRFVLQPLVENAIRHGLSGRSAAGVIEIVALVHGDEVIVRVVDNGVGLERASTSTGRGIGLTNVRDRLLILYGDDDRLRLSANETGGAVAELRIPARRRDGSVSTTAEHPTTNETIVAEQEDRPIEIPAWLRHRAVSIPLVWFICGVMWTQQSFLVLTMRGQLNGASWLSLAKSDMLSALVWALFTPITLYITTAFPLRREQLGLRVIAYLALTGIATVAHAGLWHLLASSTIPLFAPAYEMAYIVGILVFATIVAVGHRRRLIEWMHSREAAAAELRLQLDEAQQRATKLQSIPPVLLNALDGIGETARHDPALTERQLTVLADYLRIALECSDARGVTPERERSLDLAVAALRQTGAYSLDLTLSA